MHLGNIDVLYVYITYHYYHCNFTLHCNFPTMFEENTKNSPFFWIGGTSGGDSQIPKKKNDFKNTIFVRINGKHPPSTKGWILSSPIHQHRQGWIPTTHSRWSHGWRLDPKNPRHFLYFNMNGFDHQKRWQDTVDGQNPAPPGMVKTLWIVG